MNHYSTLSFILSCVKSFKTMILLQVLGAVIFAIDINLGPYLIKLMVDTANATDSLARADLSYYAVLLVILSFSFSGFYRVYDYLWLIFSNRLEKHISLKLTDRLMEHSFYFYQNNFAGGLSNNVKEASRSVPIILETLFESFLHSFLTVMIAIIAYWQINAVFATALTSWAIIFLAVSGYLSKRAKSLSINSAAIKSKITGKLVDIFGNMFSVHLFNGQNFERDRLAETYDQSIKANRKRDFFFLKMFSFQSASVVIYQGVCLYFLVKNIQSNNITSGDFVFIFTLNTTIIKSLWNITKYINRFATEIGNISQSLNIIYSPTDVTDDPSAKKLIINKPAVETNSTLFKQNQQTQGGQITFKNVSFFHKDAGPLFNNLSITIQAGQKVGLVGYSGSGKSTFVNLILRLYDPSSGQILIDNQDIAKITQHSLRKNIGLIPQDPYLFQRSLAENIDYGNFNSSHEEIIAAAKHAHAHEFIDLMPQKYETLVGERGVKLSGGQRQRIAIARAILKNPPILILDEATSHLDSLTESYIQESLLELMIGKTTLVIAHRLSTLLHMDRILVLDKGKIIEQGTHKELINNGSLYSKLWERQVDGFLPFEE